MNEPPRMPDDLVERLTTTKKRCDIALLLVQYGKEELLPTILEDIFFGSQCILDYYCVKDD